MFSAQYYYPIFLHVVLIGTFIQYILCINMSDYKLLQVQKSAIVVLFFSLLFIIIIGFRPISGFYFGDTSNYAHSYYLYQDGITMYDPDASEWFFQWLMYSCAKVMDVQRFFLIIEMGYILPMLWACNRLMRNNITLAMLFCFGAFSFFTYGVNGIRNGFACSLVLLAFSFIQGKRIELFIAVLLCVLAYNIHHSTVLPILCMVFSLFYKNTKAVYFFWIVSIFISVVAGGFVESFFAGLGFDDRLEQYLQGTDDDDLFSHTGFRWDFLLYSAMPILLGYYIIFKRRVYDQTYLLLLHTYILSNAFWVMLIRASYSNRFAYLSWFIYPFVLAYPLLKLPIWKDQGNKVGLILMAHVLFTYLMWIRG